MLNHPSLRAYPIADFRREVDRLFDDFWSIPAAGTEMSSAWTPAADIEEGSDHFMLSLEVPGIKKDELKIEIVENQVLISGERKHEERCQGKGGLYSERRFGRFQRIFTLPTNADPGKIEAQYQDGILKVYVPKSEAAKPRQVKIGDSSSGSFFNRLLGKKEGDSKALDHSSGDRVAS